MKSVSKVRWNKQMLLGVIFMAMVLVFGLGTAFVSHAESKGKIVASSSVNIRQEANASSSKIGSAERGAEVDVRGKVTASDGTMWYQVYVNGTTLGYIRGDLVEITDGSTPPTVTQNDTVTPGTETPSTPVATDGVTAVEPVSATVTNSKTVRVRAGASTDTSIVTTAQNGVALTVTGQTTGEDGKVWYQVNFIADGAEIVGFIRSDYVALSGELVPVTTEPPVVETPSTETPPVEETPVVEDKDWDTQLQGSDWYLLNKVKGEQIKISDLYEGVEHNKTLYEESQKEVKSQKVVVIILVLLVIALAAIVAMLVFKIKDMKDAAYFNQVEKETLRRRSVNKAQGSQKVMHTVGGEKNPASKPQGTKPGGGQGQTVRPQGGQSQGSRPAGAQGQTVRPQGQSQGSKPAGAQGQSQGSKPTGAQGQTVRPAGAQPQGSKPAGAQGQSVRPQGEQPQGSRPVGAQSQNGQPQGGQVQGNRTVSPRPQARPEEVQGADGQNQGWQSKNFVADDDEFEFEFLNWNGNEDK